MNTIKFDQLPDLCLRKVFAFLGLRDLVRCRTVSRQFKFYADRTKLTELVVKGKAWSKPKNWLGTDRQIDSEHSITLKAFKSARSSPFKLDQQLKFLHIWSRSNDSTYNALNGLKQLQHLEIFANYPSGRTRRLVLPNLKVLAIQKSDSFFLKTPKLEVLSCRSMSGIEFAYPETIRRVECGNESDDFGELARLSSIEVLDLNLDEEGFLGLNGLSSLSSLKELHLQLSLWAISEHGDEELLNSVLNLMRRDDLKLSVNEMLLIDAKQLPIPKEQTHVGYDSENNFKFINYRLLRRDSYPEVTSLNFNLLMSLDFEISKDFFERFPRIQKLIATDVIDRELFEWFLKNATALRELKLVETSVDQATVDRLPMLSSQLTRLELYESSGLVTNLKFLLQFEHLEVFETDRLLRSFDLAAVAFRRSAKLKRLLCRTENAFVEILRSSALADDYTLGLFRIARNKKSIKKFDRKGLTWAQLAALYDSKRADLIIAPAKKKMRIKQVE